MDNYSDILWEKSINYKWCKNYEKTIELLNASLELSPYHVESLMLLGEVYFELKEYEEAIVCFKKIKNIDFSQDLDHITKEEYDFDRCFSLRLLAKSYFEMEDYNNSLEMCKELILLNYRISNPYDIVSKIYNRIGQHLKSEYFYKLYKKRKREIKRNSKKLRCIW